MEYVFGRPMNTIIHGGDYNPEQWLDYPDILEKDIEYMKQSGITEATLGVFSWAMYEPREGEFDFDWLQSIMDKLYENGIYTILATPSGARPAWLDAKYPEAMRVDGRGVRNHHGWRHNHCMTSPLYRVKVKIIDSKLAERFGGHPGLLMWHISNEFGGQCFCDECRDKFRTYLRGRYHNDINELNHEWWTTFWSHRYNDFDEVEPPYENGETSVKGLNLEWKRFTTWNTADFLSAEIAALREFSPRKDVPVTTNFMKRFWDLDYRVLAGKIDVISWDSYPMLHNDHESYADTMLESAFDHAVMRGMKRDRPFMLMESTPSQVNWTEFNKPKRPLVLEQFAMQAVACGSDTVQYFQWRKSRGAVEQHHGAVIDHIGTNDTRVFREVAETGRKLKLLGAVEGSVMKNEAAIIFEWDNWWAIEDAFAFAGATKNYDSVCYSYWKKLMELGVEADVISTRDSLEGYKLIIAPMLYLLRDDIAERLREFVKKGGILLGTYMTGYVGENGLCWLGGFPGDGLSELFGVISEEVDVLYPAQRNGVRFGEEVWEVRDYAEVLRLRGAETLGTYTSDYYQDTAALTRNTFGAGAAYYQAARCGLEGMDGFFERLFAEAGITQEKYPAGIEHHVRYGEGKRFDFFLNLGETDVELSDITGTDLLTGDRLSGKAVIQPKRSIIVEK